MAEQFIDDQVLVSLYIKGQENALEKLLIRHKRKIFSYIFMMTKDRQLSEDIFQDTFFKVINTLKKGNYNEEGKFLPWVMRIAHNLIIDHFRKQKKIKTVDNVVFYDEGEEVDVFSRISYEELNIEEKLVKKQVDLDLKHLISRLPEEQKEVLMLRHCYDMSFKEIADLTKVSINTALGRMRYALINLKKMAEDANVTLSV